jgi:hypothetical protein
MTIRRALPVAAAAMLALGGGALALSKVRAPLTLFASRDCPSHKATALMPLEHAYLALNP